MSKVSVYATLLAVAFSFIAISCTGPIFIKPPVAAAPAAGTATLASATVPGSAAAPAGATAVGVTGPLSGGAMYFAFSVFGFVALGSAMFLLRGKPPASA